MVWVVGRQKRFVDSRPLTPSTKVRRSLDSHSVTSFHIRALSQADVDDAADEITKAVELRPPSEIVQVEYLDKFSQVSPHLTSVVSVYITCARICISQHTTTSNNILTLCSDVVHVVWWTACVASSRTHQSNMPIFPIYEEMFAKV